MVRVGTGSGLIQWPGHGLDQGMNLGECLNLGNDHRSRRGRGRGPELGSGQLRGCGLSRRSVQGRGLVLSLGQGRDGLEPVVREKTGPGSKLSRGSGKFLGRGLSKVSGQMLGGD